MATKKPDILPAGELRKLYLDEHRSMAYIGALYGLSAPSVLHRLRVAGIPTRPRRTTLTREVLEAAIAKGLSQAQMARRFGLTDRAVFQQLRRQGLHAPDGRAIPRLRPHRDRIRFSGYWMLYRPDHPQADKRGRIMEHRLVMEQLLGRPLLSEEVVHHMNHVRDDNRPENLMLLPNQAAHGREHYPKGKPLADGNAARWSKRR